MEPAWVSEADINDEWFEPQDDEVQELINFISSPQNTPHLICQHTALIRRSLTTMLYHSQGEQMYQKMRPCLSSCKTCVEKYKETKEWMVKNLREENRNIFINSFNEKDLSRIVEVLAVPISSTPTNAHLPVSTCLGLYEIMLNPALLDTDAFNNVARQKLFATIIHWKPLIHTPQIPLSALILGRMYMMSSLDAKLRAWATALDVQVARVKVKAECFRRIFTVHYESKIHDLAKSVRSKMCKGYLTPPHAEFYEELENLLREAKPFIGELYRTMPDFLERLFKLIELQEIPQQYCNQLLYHVLSVGPQFWDGLQKDWKKMVQKILRLTFVPSLDPEHTDSSPIFQTGTQIALALLHSVSEFSKDDFGEVLSTVSDSIERRLTTGDKPEEALAKTIKMICNLSFKAQPPHPVPKSLRQVWSRILVPNDPEDAIEFATAMGAEAICLRSNLMEFLHSNISSPEDFHSHSFHVFPQAVITDIVFTQNNIMEIFKSLLIHGSSLVIVNENYGLKPTFVQVLLRVKNTLTKLFKSINEGEFKLKISPDVKELLYLTSAYYMSVPSLKPLMTDLYRSTLGDLIVNTPVFESACMLLSDLAMYKYDISQIYWGTISTWLRRVLLGDGLSVAPAPLLTKFLTLVWLYCRHVLAPKSKTIRHVPSLAPTFKLLYAVLDLFRNHVLINQAFEINPNSWIVPLLRIPAALSSPIENDILIQWLAVVVLLDLRMHADFEPSKKVLKQLVSVGHITQQMLEAHPSLSSYLALVPHLTFHDRDEYTSYKSGSSENNGSKYDGITSAASSSLEWPSSSRLGSSSHQTKNAITNYYSPVNQSSSNNASSCSQNSNQASSSNTWNNRASSSGNSNNWSNRALVGPGEANRALPGSVVSAKKTPVAAPMKQPVARAPAVYVPPPVSVQSRKEMDAELARVTEANKRKEMTKPEKQIMEVEVINLNQGQHDKDALRQKEIMQRNANRYRRVRSLEELQSYIVQMNYVTLQYSTEVEIPNRKIPASFQGVDHYIECFEPLLLLEIQAQMSKSKEEEVQETTTATIDHIGEVGGFHEITLGSMPKKYISQDVLLLWPKRFESPRHTKDASNKHCLGFVESTVTKKGQTRGTHSLIVRVKLGGLDIVDHRQGLFGELKINSTWKFQRVFSLATSCREWQALQTCDSLKMSTELFNPKTSSTKTLLHTPSQVDKLVSSLDGSRNFNTSQRKAITETILHNGFNFIQGPPGTGKTKTVIGLLSLLVALKQTPILVCTASNSAIDEIMLRILAHGLYDMSHAPPAMVDRFNIVRVGISPDMPTAVVAKSLAKLAKDLTSKPGVSPEEASRTILRRADIVCATLSASGSSPLLKANVDFKTVIIDEAAQAVELSTLIPLQYNCERCIMIGDPKQLPATVFSTVATKCAYERSLFARFADLTDRTSLNMLNIQYRMLPQISEFPRVHFYEGHLTDGAVKHTPAWHSTAAFGPLKFYDLSASSMSKSSSSLNNLGEAKFIVEMIKKLITSYPNTNFENSIAILTPYQSQKAVILGGIDVELEKTGNAALQKVWRSIDVSTVDGYQGKEKSIVIFSTVRTYSGSNSVGFLSDIRRMNVALTRAKYSLWVVGQAQALQANSEWLKYLRHLRHNSCCIVPVKDVTDYWSSI